MTITWFLVEGRSHIFDAHAWTAPGDDGYVGIAANYEMRWCIDDSMLLVNDFWNQGRFTDLPFPDTAGTPQSYQSYLAFTDGYFVSGHYVYFAIMTVDEAGNWSDISNIKQTYYQFVDITAPGVIVDFEVIINPR